MKKTNLRCAAFTKFRIVVACFLCVVAALLGLSAMVAVARQSENTSATNFPRWLTRLASTLGMSAPGREVPKAGCESCARNAERDRSGGGAALLSRMAEQRVQGTFRMPAAAPYAG